MLSVLGFLREKIDILEEIGRYLLDRMGCVVGVGEPRIAFGFVDGSISERSFDDFIGEELYVYIVTYKGDSDEKREEVVKTAKLFLSVEKEPYSVVYCNCESMALYCWTGRYESAKNNHRFTFSKIFVKL
jgi:hypothetical protein